MTIFELGALGEFVGSIAVVVTLVYLTLQMRRNMFTTQAASHHAITDSINQVNLAVAESPELARIWTVGLEDRSSLTEEETWQQNMLLLSYFHIFDSMHYEAHVGAGDSGLLLAEEPGITHLMSLSGVSEWWDENVFAYGPEFRAYVENLR